MLGSPHFGELPFPEKHGNSRAFAISKAIPTLDLLNLCPNDPSLLPLTVSVG